MTKETIYTGDYGLSDCLIVSDSNLNFADSLFEVPVTTITTIEKSLTITKEDNDFPF